MKRSLPCRLIRRSVGFSPDLLDRRPQIVDRRDGLAVDFLDDVARLDAGRGRAAVRIDILHEQALRVLRRLHPRGELRRQRRHRDAQRRLVVGAGLVGVHPRRLLGVRFVELHAQALLAAVAHDDQLAASSPGPLPPRGCAACWCRGPATPLNDWITSPRFTPARSAALPGATELTIAPVDVLQPEALGQIGRDALHRDAELRPRDLALRPQLLHHVLRHVRRNGEADADVAARLATGSAS